MKPPLQTPLTAIGYLRAPARENDVPTGSAESAAIDLTELADTDRELHRIYGQLPDAAKNLGERASMVAGPERDRGVSDGCVG